MISKYIGLWIMLVIFSAVVSWLVPNVFEKLKSIHSLLKRAMHKIAGVR